MTIDHLALYVDDLEGARQFFMQYFGARSNNRYHNPKTGLSTYFLTFEGGARLEIMSRPDLEHIEKHEKRTGYAHLAFSVGSRDEVDRLTERLRQAGHRVMSGPRVTGDGCYESCVEGPEQNLIEITE